MNGYLQGREGGGGEGCDIYAVTFYMIPPTQQLTQLPPTLFNPHARGRQQTNIKILRTMYQLGTKMNYDKVRQTNLFDSPLLST